jgi:RNA polymerase sigma factor (sigma-70 family)
MVEAISNKFNSERVRSIRDSEIYGYLSQELVSCRLRFNPSKASFDKYLSSHLFNKAIDFVRRSKRKKRCHGCFSMDQEDINNLPQPSSNNVVSTDLLPTLLAECSQDSPRDVQDRMILMEHYLTGRSVAELSKKYNTTRVTIYNRIKKSLKKIRENHNLSFETGGDIMF